MMSKVIKSINGGEFILSKNIYVGDREFESRFLVQVEPVELDVEL